MIEVNLKRPGRVDVKIPLFPTAAPLEGFQLIRNLCRKRGIEIAEERFAEVETSIPELLTPGAAESAGGEGLPPGENRRTCRRWTPCAAPSPTIAIPLRSTSCRNKFSSRLTNRVISTSCLPTSRSSTRSALAVGLNARSEMSSTDELGPDACRFRHPYPLVDRPSFSNAFCEDSKSAHLASATGWSSRFASG